MIEQTKGPGEPKLQPKKSLRKKTTKKFKNQDIPTITVNKNPIEDVEDAKNKKKE